jgi:hypothetical protein
MTKPKSVSFAELRSRKSPVVRSTEIFLDSDTAEAINRARVEAEAAERLATDKAGDHGAHVRRDEARGILERLQREATETGQVASFSFRSIGRKAFEKLVSEHPATEDQQKEARDRGLEAGLPANLSRLSWNAETFPPALIAASSVEPKITHEEAYELFNVSEDWNAAELTALFVTARSAQDTRDVADLGKLRGGSQPTLN